MATGSINISSNISRNTLLVNYPPSSCKSLLALNGNKKVSLTWEDPDDYSIPGKTIKWKYTRIVRKTGGFPINENDGVIIIESSIKNQYASTGFIDSNVINGTTYYYSAFACSEDGVFNRELVQAMAEPKACKIMTAVISLGNSNPETCISYKDDATSMPHGIDATGWQDFFGYKPCLFKNGKVVGYLNPNDYTKFENGTAADITSGNAGDVMIEFPRRGVKISKSGKVITVSMTDDQDNSDFTYYAHQRGSANKSYFYLGAYLGYNKGNKLRSLSGYSLNSLANAYEFTIASYGKNMGSNYGCICWYQWLYLQVMYILQFKTLNSQSAGLGIDHHNILTGHGNLCGLFANQIDVNNAVKLFGLEDLWGAANQFVNNIYIEPKSYKVLTTTDDSVISVDDYIKHGSVNVLQNDSGYVRDVVGNCISGFLPIFKSGTGSSSTYFCDYASIGDGYLAVGGYSNYSNSDENGIFNVKALRTYGTIGSRLQYL